jgi:hypothetical protein
MRTKLPVKIPIRVHKVDATVILTVNEGGIEMCVAGTRTKVFGSWRMVVDALQTPSSVPSYLMHKPYELLAHNAAKVKAKQTEGDS